MVIIMATDELKTMKCKYMFFVPSEKFSTQRVDFTITVAIFKSLSKNIVKIQAYSILHKYGLSQTL